MDESGPDASIEALARLADAASEVLWVATADFEEVLFVNAAYEDVWGGSVEALRADPAQLLDGIHPDDRPEFEDALDRAGEGEEAEVECHVLRPAEDERHVRVRLDPLADESGDVDRVLGRARDVTSGAEEELRRQNERLDRFAHVVSHDLRNPLGVARSHLELARSEFDSDHLDTVDRAHERMTELIEDVLAMARSGGDVDDPEPIPLDSTAESSWKTVETGEATLAVDADREILAGQGRLRRLFENLLGNAVEHGGPGVAVTVGATADGFYVADDGPGVPPADREVVFEMGYTTGDEGTGFGLSIVAEIVEAHGWEIEVGESDAGGARVEISGVEFADGSASPTEIS